VNKVACALTILVFTAVPSFAGNCFRCISHPPEGAICDKGYSSGGKLCSVAGEGPGGSETCYTLSWCSSVIGDTDCSVEPGTCTDYQWTGGPDVGNNRYYSLVAPPKAIGTSLHVRLLAAFSVGGRGLLPGYLQGVTDVGGGVMVEFEGRSELVGGHLVIDLALKGHPTLEHVVIETWDRGRAGSASMTAKGTQAVTIESW
jgi:hypothetical protein